MNDIHDIFMDITTMTATADHLPESLDKLKVEDSIIEECNQSEPENNHRKYQIAREVLGSMEILDIKFTLKLNLTKVKQERIRHNFE